MGDLLDWLTRTEGYIPRKDCGEIWTQELIWLHVGSDLAIWGAYLSIPAALLYFARRERQMRFSRLFVLFAAFILACGFVHFLDAMTFSRPVYNLLGAVKLLTAIVSWITVLALIPEIPRILEAMTALSRAANHSTLRRVLPPPRSLAARGYVIAVVVSVAALLLRLLLDSALGSTHAYAIAFPAIVLVAWEAGFGPTILATTLCALGVVYWIIPPSDGLLVTDYANQVGLMLFLLSGLGCGLLGEAQQFARDRASLALSESQARQAELEAEILRGAKIDAALRASEGQFRSMADSVSMMIWIANADRKRTYFNRTWLEFTGRPLESLLGDGWKECIAPADRSRYLAVHDAAFDARDAFEVEYRLLRHDGVARWVLARATPRFDPDGQFDGFTGVCIDVTDRKAAIEALKESNARKTAMLETALDCVITIDARNRIVEFNPAAERTFGYSRDEAGGRELDELIIPPRYRDAHRRGLVRYHATGEGPMLNRRLELTALRRDGTEFPIEVAITPIRTGEELFFTSYLRDITERKQAVAALKHSEERFRTLAENIPQLVWASTPDGSCDYLSRQWTEYTGVPEPKQLGAGWLAAVHPDDADELAKAWKQCVTCGTEFDAEFRIRNREGMYRWFKAQAVPVHGADGTVIKWIGTNTDIDDQKRQAQTLEQLVRERTSELHRSNSELEQFAYVASHDLQEPLRKIQAFGDRLRDRFRPNLPDQGREYVDRMLASAGRMSKLIDDLLMYSRITTHARPCVPTDLNEILAAVLDDLAVRVEKSGGTVEVGSLPTLDADPTQMRQLFQNLIGNALKFATPGRTPVVRVRGESGDAGTESHVCRIEVEDNGIGFDEKYLDRIFQVFQRLHGRGEYEGTGVGLAICKKIVHRHGGTITARSQPGRGATFIILLPAHQPKPRSLCADDEHLSQR